MKSVLVYAVRIFADFLSATLLIRALISWFLMSGSRTAAKIYEITSFITDPVVLPCQRLLSRFNTGPIDFSVVLAYFVVNLLEMAIIRLIGLF